MRSIDELINTSEPGWELVSNWISKAKNKVEVLASDLVNAKEALYKTQVTTRSPMGAIIYATGGLLIDNGWIRILGSGHTKLNRSLPDWNLGKTFSHFGEAAPFLLIADDAVGGFFALNGKGLGNDLGKIYYLAPESLNWEPLDLSYTDFLNFCFNSDLDAFYDSLRWKNWREEVAKLDGNKVYNFYPALWTKEGKNINKSSRRVIPVEEQFHLNMDIRKQLGLDKN
ncbi:DUF2625 domain-containing protein [Emticicia sp. BO119]|nr:DUF2625 domain-containing protein [Emticicia sp. BO119]